MPTFFLISGFYLPRGEEGVSRIKRTVQILFKLTTIWGFLFLIYDNLFIEKLSDFIIYSPKELMDLLLFNRFAHGFHLWYLSAYLYALLLVLLFQRLHLLNNRYVLIIIITLLLFLNLLLGNYSVIIWKHDLPFYYSRNGLLLAFPMLLIGKCLRERMKEEALGKYRFWFILFFLLIYLGCVLETLQWDTTFSITTGTLSTIVASIVLLLFCLSFGKGRESKLARVGQNYSLYIYILHPFLLPLNGLIHNRQCVAEIIVPILVFAISFGGSVMLISFKNYCNQTCLQNVKEKERVRQ